MTITITAFERSPDGGKGLARDTRVRWALEEVGQPYEVRLVSFRAMKEPVHRALHPFGQIPTYEEGDLVLFETGAIVLHIAERHAGLLPDDANARARAITWMFAALNTVEPPILELVTARILEGDKTWSRGAPASGRGSHPRPARPAFRSPRRCRLARWCVQRGRPDDGVGAAQVEIVGHSGRISEPGRLCRPRRSTARLPAGFRCSTGGLQRQATDRLIQAARTFLIGFLAPWDGLIRRLAPSSSVRPSKNWMISRQGSHLNMLRDAAAFDISIRQPGQSGFVEDVETRVLEIEVIEIEVLKLKFWKCCCWNHF